MILVSVADTGEDIDLSQFQGPEYLILRSPVLNNKIKTKYQKPNVVGTIHEFPPTQECTEIEAATKLINTLAAHALNSTNVVRQMTQGVKVDGVIAITQPYTPVETDRWYFDSHRIFVKELVKEDRIRVYEEGMYAKYDFFTTGTGTFIRLTQFAHHYPNYNICYSWWAEYLYRMEYHDSKIPFDDWVWKMFLNSANTRVRSVYK